VYDAVCITAFFDVVPPTDYGVNRAIDARLKVFSWEDLEALLRLARVPRASRLMQQARATVKRAQQAWPSLLESAPESMRRAVTERLKGGRGPYAVAAVAAAFRSSTCTISARA